MPHYLTAMKIKPKKPLRIWNIMWSVTTTPDRFTSMAYSDANKTSFIIIYNYEGAQIKVYS